ncbi:MAG: hypothetical protein LBE49_07605, partial [Deltaproteobacteria bacterium]|nr:hypothetical protein [Deltaproteobacteria bacterium]
MEAEGEAPDSHTEPQDLNSGDHTALAEARPSDFALLAKTFSETVPLMISDSHFNKCFQALMTAAGHWGAKPAAANPEKPTGDGQALNGSAPAFSDYSPPSLPPEPGPSPAEGASGGDLASLLPSQPVPSQPVPSQPAPSLPVSIVPGPIPSEQARGLAFLGEEAEDLFAMRPLEGQGGVWPGSGALESGPQLQEAKDGRQEVLANQSHPAGAAASPFSIGLPSLPPRKEASKLAAAVAPISSRLVAGPEGPKQTQGWGRIDKPSDPRPAGDSGTSGASSAFEKPFGHPASSDKEGLSGLRKASWSGSFEKAPEKASWGCFEPVPDAVFEIAAPEGPLLESASEPAFEPASQEGLQEGAQEGPLSEGAVEPWRRPQARPEVQASSKAGDEPPRGLELVTESKNWYLGQNERLL